MLMNEFLDKYYQSIEKKGLNKTVVCPPSMMVDEIEDEDGWVKWKLAESKVGRSDIFELEETYKIKFPSEYKEYAQSKQFMDIQIAEYTLFGINEINTIEKNLNVFPKEVISKGYIPIGQINDEDFIVFNFNTKAIETLGYDNFEIKNELFKSMEGLLNQLSGLI